ncbi:RNA-binding protein 5 [Trypanosoma conorhini]|uniref:RNA-binding protein 5 n=1 Tax=Trypanosoma conorhini TaxID=83891 RepID=A0A3S5IQR7_9TRYP|nr:RNA-binding protein 5 [Trypanosoma conorhini]RNF01948.1 RNA-binding protein 5 [Trypanosoma conorhini]
MGSPTSADKSEFGRNVYVASLPLDFDDQQLFDLFALYGPISSARIMRKKGTRESKGYGFVLYKNASAAELAISTLSGSVIGGNRIQVRLAHPDASTAYNSQRTPKSSSSTPALQSMHQLPPSPPLPLPQQPPLVPPQPQALVPAATTNPAMMMATLPFPTVYPTMYSPVVPPVLSASSTSAVPGVFPPQLMLVPQFTSQAQQMAPQTAVYMVFPETGVSSSTLV